MATKVKGTVTRLVDEGDRKRCFIRPDDPGVLRELDGKHFTASGEVPCKVDSLDGYKIGDEAEFDVG